MVFLRRLEPLPDDPQLAPRGLDAPLRLLLEGVQGVDSPGEPRGVDRPERVAIVVRYDLQHPRPNEALQDLRIPMLAAHLGLVQREADRLADLGWERLQVP
jgi:hypothetical protein